MPKEETIQLMKVRNVIGETTDSPAIGPETSLISNIKSQIIRAFGSPDLIHAQGAFEPNTYIELGPGENNVIPLISDGTYLYAGTQTSPGKIIRIYLKTFTKDMVITLDDGENNVHSLVIHKDHLYAGLGTSPAKVVKINRLSFTKESTLTLNDGENIIYQLGIDGIFLYAGLHTTPGKITRIKIDTFTRYSTLTFGADINKVSSICISRGYLYAIFSVGPGILKQVSLNTFTESRSLTFDTGENYPYYIGTDGIYFYVTFSLTPGKVIKVAFYPESGVLSKIDAITYPDGFNTPRSIMLNGTELCISFHSSPSRIGFIDQATFKRTYEYTFGAGFDYLHYMYTDGTYIYAPHYMSPSKISRVYIFPTHDIFQKATTLLLEQTHTGVYSLYPTLADGVLVTSGAGVYVMGAYAQIIPVNTVKTMFYITSVFINRVSASAGFEVEIATGAAASESKIATVFVRTAVLTSSNECILPIPIKVSSNTRISARMADSTGELTARIRIHYKT